MRQQSVHETAAPQAEACDPSFPHESRVVPVFVQVVAQREMIGDEEGGLFEVVR